ncbi:MAG: DUF1553 domain-containing protein [Limisphaerales bacterium]
MPLRFPRWLLALATTLPLAMLAAEPPARIGDAWSDPRNPVRELWKGSRLDLWALKPLATNPPPARTGAKHPIDQFLRAKSPSAKAAPEASRLTLLRRLSYDLTGLPPTAEEVDAFLADRTPDAHERLVERLLASPRYGEHQARWWLDVVRYSDSNGFDWDEFRPRAWRFRDYVIRSFNADKPFDRFIREQLAGDELLAAAPRDTAEQDALLATGFLRLGPHDNSAASFNEQDRSRTELMFDLVETTGSAFLGLTFNCCRCHDHKFDPLLQADYFRLRAFFEPVKFNDATPLDHAAEQEAIRQHNEAVDAEAKVPKAARDALLEVPKQKLRAERVAKLSVEEAPLADLPKEKQTGELKAKFDAVQKKITPSDKEILAALGKDEKARHDQLAEQIRTIEAKRKAFTFGLLMSDGDGPPAETKVLFQGNHKQPREAVVAGFLSALDPNPAAARRGANTKTTGRRLALAEWIASPVNPLTARVLANRIWQQHFGEGLVATPNDFGLAGARPTYPELLDWLAGELLRCGWSVKHLHRVIVTSAAYRAAAGKPQVSFVRTPRRLTAEQLRDSLLAVSGLLTAKDSGPPIWPELPAEILQANPAFLDDNAEKTKAWYPSPKADQFARSLFLVQKRTVKVPFMETFDLPENAVSCARRDQSIVAPQAHTLLNGPLTVAAAQALAQRVQREAGEASTAQVKHAFRLALQRVPTREEAAACTTLLAQRSLPELCRALLNVNEFLYVD